MGWGAPVIQLTTTSAGYSTLFFNTNMDDSDDECLVFHCVSFVDPGFSQHLRCWSWHYTLLVKSVAIVFVYVAIYHPQFSRSPLETLALWPIKCRLGLSGSQSDKQVIINKSSELEQSN